MGFIETSYGGKPNLSDVNIDSALNMGSYGISSSGSIDISGISSENAGEVDLNNCDLVGVKRFMCEDYLGAVTATASDTEQKTLLLNDITGNTQYTKLFRIPSNFIQSTIKIKYSVKASNIDPLTTTIKKYNPQTSSYTNVFSKVTSINTSEVITSSAITVKAGELYCIHKNDNYNLSTSYIYGNSTKVLYDLAIYTGVVWEVIN